MTHKVYVKCDEQYPFYFLGTHNWTSDGEATVSDVKFRKWQRIIGEFQEMQDELAAIVEGKYDNQG